MGTRSPHAIDRFSLLILATALFAVLLVPTAADAAKKKRANIAKRCANADLVPRDAADAKKAETATRCLINRTRNRKGLRSVRFNSDLQKAADWQANDMLEHRYFAHERSGGPGFAGRITRFGYGSSDNGYSLGENIAWATCEIATPRQMVKMWMDSPPHRANILRRQFKEQAVSVLYSEGNVGGDYDSDVPFLIYVNQFGARY